jgi:hypothetical protein
MRPRILAEYTRRRINADFIYGIGIIVAGCLPIVAWVALEVYRG